MIGERNYAETSARLNSINGIFCTEDHEHGEISRPRYSDGYHSDHLKQWMVGVFSPIHVPSYDILPLLLCHIDSKNAFRSNQIRIQRENPRYMR